MSLVFKVFTFNVWGLVHSKQRKARMAAIAEVLLANEFDVVCLQEVWVKRDFKRMKEKVSRVLPYSHYFYSGVVGSGVCILSKHPIEETFFHQWSVNGYIHKIQHGDWWGGKGVGLCRLKVDQGENTFSVNVFTTHLHAEYNRESDAYQTHRVLQAYDTAQFILLTSSSVDFTILAGDLNTEPGDLAYRIFETIPGLTDAYKQADNIHQDMYAYTCESHKNSFTPSSLIKDKCMGKRIDYVMYHQGSNVNIDLKSYNFPLPVRVPKQSYSYSDHEAILVELSVKKDDKAVNNNCTDNAAEKLMVLKESVELCNEALKSISITKLFYWLGALILFLLLITSLVIPEVMDTAFLNSYSTTFSVIRVILAALMIFCLLMATLWNRMEMHGVLSGKLAMEVSLGKMISCKNL